MAPEDLAYGGAVGGRCRGKFCNPSSASGDDDGLAAGHGVKDRGEVARYVGCSHGRHGIRLSDSPAVASPAQVEGAWWWRVVLATPRLPTASAPVMSDLFTRGRRGEAWRTKNRLRRAELLKHGRDLLTPVSGVTYATLSRAAVTRRGRHPVELPLRLDGPSRAATTCPMNASGSRTCVPSSMARRWPGRGASCGCRARSGRCGSLASRLAQVGWCCAGLRALHD